MKSLQGGTSKEGREVQECLHSAEARAAHGAWEERSGAGAWEGGRGPNCTTECNVDRARLPDRVRL